MLMSTWTAREMQDADLNDKRLNERLVQVLDQLGAHPSASIPAASGGYPEMAAAYRFFDNGKCGFENVLQPHLEATYRRIAERRLVILSQDTTELVYDRPQQELVGAGPLDHSRRGMLLHPLVAFTPDGTPLGIVYAEAWTRADDVVPNTKKTRAERAKVPIEKKESMRWIDAWRAAEELARAYPKTTFIMVADSESDIYELLDATRGRPENLHWIVRGGYNRALSDDTEGLPDPLRETVQKQDSLFTREIHIRARDAKVSCPKGSRKQPRQSRTATTEVRAGCVTLRPPRRPDRKLNPVSVNVVLVSEVDPPADEVPIEWILLSSLPIDGDDDQAISRLVMLIIDYYCVRWMIEIFFRVLKSGCRVEERRFEHIDRMLPCLAIYLIVAWRTLYVCRLGRATPDLDCEAVFEPAEWKSAYQFVTGRRPPAKPPTLQEMVRLIAQLGGYVNRKRKDEPGPQTVWLGLQRVHDITQCWLKFRSENGKDV